MASIPDPEEVAQFLGRSGDVALIATAEEHVPLVAYFVRAYTRGQGFDPSTGDVDSAEVADELRSVIMTATARLVTNPAQLERETADGYTAVGAFNGFSLPELAVLHNYRRRAG